MPDWLARILRTFVQLIAAGALTGLINQLTQDMDAKYVPYMLMASTLLVTFCQNYAEQQGWIPAMLKPANADTERA